MGRRRGVGGGGWGGWSSCVREAQLGNEKCNPPPRIPPPYTHTYGTHTYTHDPHLFILPSGKERWRGVKGRERQGGIGRDGEGDR